MGKINRVSFCIVVLAVAIMIADLSVVSAASINIIDTDTNELLSSLKTGIDNNDNYVKKKVDVVGSEVKIDISNTEKHSVMGALLYLCGDRPPSECAISKPIEFTGQVNASLNLAEIQKNGKAGLLTIVKSNQSHLASEDFNKSWIAGWDYIENGVVQKALDAEIDVYTSNDVQDIKNFIEIYGMIPASFIDKLDFKSKKIHQMRGDAYKIGRSVEKINITNPKLVSELERQEGYVFAFPSDQKIYSPISIYNIEKSCGNAECEIGENYQNCWLDCVCPEGQSPSEKGCIPSSNVKLIVDDIDPHPVDCLTEEMQIDYKDGSSCQATSGLTVKLHVENAPVNYTCPQFYFGMAPGGGQSPKQAVSGLNCMPTDDDNIMQYIVGQKQKFCSGSNYECFLIPPPLEDVKTKSVNKAMWIGMHTNVETKKGAETMLIYNTTKLKFDVLGLDLSELGLEELEKVKKNAEKDQKEIRNIMVVVNDISSTIFYVEAVLLLCWAIASVFSWHPAGAAIAKFCGGFAFGKWGITTVIVYIVMLVINLIINACMGNPYSQGIIPPTPRWLVWVGDKLGINLDWKGLSAEIMSTGASKKGGKKISDIYSDLPGVIKHSLGWWLLMEATGLGDLCGRLARLEDRAKQKIEESQREAQINIKSGLSKSLSNLIWVKGSETGKSATVCNGESVTGYYSFGVFGCSDLWFSFNSKNRPVCNFTSGKWQENIGGKWMDESSALNGRIFNETCTNINATEYVWMPQDIKSPDLGVRSYNVTDESFLVFNRTAPSLFSQSVNGEKLKIFASCDSQSAGQKIESEFKLVNYSETCPDMI